MFSASAQNGLTSGVGMCKLLVSSYHCHADINLFAYQVREIRFAYLKYSAEISENYIHASVRPRDRIDNSIRILSQAVL